MSERNMRGLYPILVTPFDEQYAIDAESLQSLVEFLIQNGVHGIGVAMGSEVFKYTEAERALVTRKVVDQAAGRVPIVINSGGEATYLAVHYSRLAQENGADALMALPPAHVPVGGEPTRQHYRAISDAVDLPIFIQDAPRGHVPAELALQIAQESENVKYIKVESQPAPLMVHEVSQKVGDELVIFGGAGGNYFIEELRRGSVGTMPYCSQPEAFRAVWDLYWAGDQAGARKVFYERILPVNRLVGLGRPGAAYHIHKTILQRRGVIRTNRVRGPIAPLPEIVWGELNAVIEALYG